MNDSPGTYFRSRFSELLQRFHDVAGTYMQQTQNGFCGTLGDVSVELLPGDVIIWGSWTHVSVHRSINGKRLTDGQSISLHLVQTQDSEWMYGRELLSDAQITQYFEHHGPPPIW